MSFAPRLYALGVLLATALPSGGAAAQGVIAGYAVQASNSLPLKCIDVALIDSTGATVAATRTREQGMFEFQSPSHGAYRMRFSATGIVTIETSPEMLDPTTSFERLFRLELALGDSVLKSKRWDEGETTGPLPLPQGAFPQYPADLRNAGKEGEVVIGFVVDSLGRVDASTVVAFRFSHQKFFDAVRDWLPKARFQAAKKGDIPVCAFVVTPFQFTVHGR
jgi:TonB family protein